MRHKQIAGGVEVKDADQGTVEAVFSTLNVIDSDGDVTKAGAFENGAKVRISSYNHSSWGRGDGALPVGRGTIRTTDSEAILDGRFFLATQAGKDTFEVVKQMGELQEWSYGFDILESSSGTLDGEDVQFLESVKVHEVSPVILGAGVDTRTLAVKGAKQLASDLTRQLEEVGTERFGAERIYVYVDDFDVDESWVVYAVSSPDSMSYLRGPFTRSDDAGVEIAGEFTEVERTTDYRPKGRRLSDHIDDAMAAVDEVTERIAAAATQRADQGQKLSSATIERAEQLGLKVTQLGEAVAPHKDNANLDLDLQLAREHARTRRPR